jgi:hypothetical protein
MMIGGAAQAAPPVYCPIRIARADSAFAVAVVQADTLWDSAAAGRGDHCDEQQVTGPVVRVLKGPLTPGQTVRFSLTQGACGTNSSHWVHNDFVSPGDRLTVVLRRDADGQLYQVQAEAPADYAANEKACGR